MTDPIRRILVLRPGAIGDTLVALPALLALRQAFPEAQVTVVGNRVALPLVLAAGAADVAVAFDDPRVTRLFMPGAPSADDAFLGIDIGIAWRRDPDGVLAQAFVQRGARHVVVAPSRPPTGEPVLVARHLLQSLGALGVDPARELLSPKFHLPEEIEAAASEELRAAGLADRPFVAVHAGSGSPAKNWPAERFAAVVDALRERCGLPCVVLGGPADAEALIVLQDGAGSSLAVFDERPLLFVAAILRRARAFLGNDSGLSHLAGLLGVPILVLFGPSDPMQWTPLGPRVRVIHYEPLADLPVERVLVDLADLSCENMG